MGCLVSKYVSPLPSRPSSPPPHHIFIVVLILVYRWEEGTAGLLRVSVMHFKVPGNSGCLEKSWVSSRFSCCSLVCKVERLHGDISCSQSPLSSSLNPLLPSPYLCLPSPLSLSSISLSPLYCSVSSPLSLCLSSYLLYASGSSSISLSPLLYPLSLLLSPLCFYLFSSISLSPLLYLSVSSPPRSSLLRSPFHSPPLTHHSLCISSL